MKTEVLSWRLSRTVKNQLKAESERRRTSVSALLDEYVSRGLLRTQSARTKFQQEQARLHAEAEKYVGTISGTNPLASQQVRQLVRARLVRKYNSQRARR